MENENIILRRGTWSCTTAPDCKNVFQRRSLYIKKAITTHLEAQSRGGQIFLYRKAPAIKPKAILGRSQKQILMWIYLLIIVENPSGSLFIFQLFRVSG
jgi:hypothetical protein